MKRILVTGGTGVLGSALTRELCAQGFEVVAIFHLNEERARELQRDTGCEISRADCREEAGVEALFDGRKFDGVVHLAGWNQNALAVQTSPPLWRSVLESHLDSSFLMCRAGLQHLPRGGQLLLVSSRVGLRGHVGQSAYAAAKAGVLGLMKSAALEGRERGVCVNAICPGFAPGSSGVLSPLQQEKRAGEELLPASDAREGFATLVCWLLRSNCCISGQILRPDCRI